MSKFVFPLHSVLELRRSAELEAEARLREAHRDVAAATENVLRAAASLRQLHQLRETFIVQPQASGLPGALSQQIPNLLAGEKVAASDLIFAESVRVEREAEWVTSRKRVKALEKLEEHQKKMAEATARRAEDRQLEDWVLLKDYNTRAIPG
jgi:hypothetical protein